MEYDKDKLCECGDKSGEAYFDNCIRCHKKQIDLFKEYINFLNEGSQGPTMMAYNHGWRCTQEDIDKGIEYRKKLGIE